MVKNYFKIAWRNLAVNKTYSLINIFGLTFGTLCCLYIVLFVQDQYSYDKYYTNANDIYRINTSWTVQGDKANWATVTAPVAPAMKRDFAEVEAYARVVPAIGIDHHLLRYKEKSFYEKDAVFADSTFFEVLNFYFDYGNAKNALSAPYSVVLMKSVSDKLFGKDDPSGKTIQIDNAYGKHDFTVTGVIDERLGKSHVHADFFMSMNSGGIGEFIQHNQSWAGTNIVMSYIKLRPHTQAATLEKKLPTFLNQYSGEELKKLGMAKQLYLQPVGSIHTTPGFRGLEMTKPMSPVFLFVLVFIAALIQITACINFMNLSTARASKRAKEVGVRKVIGAGRKDLIRQFLGESFFLSFIGVMVALPLLILLMPYLNQITQAEIKLNFFADYRLWLMIAGLIAITGLVAGSYPAFYLSAFEAVKVIKGNFSSHISAAGIRRSLVVLQFVFSIVLVAGIVIIYSQLNYLKNKDLGFDANQKIVFSFYTDDATGKMPAFMNDIRQLGEIKSVSRTNNAPGEMVLYDLHLFARGGNIANGADASFVNCDENFVPATGIKIVSGRDFRALDSGKIIINESLAKSLGLRAADAPGTKLFSQTGDGNPLSFEIAGVMKDYNYSSLRDEIKPMFLMYDPAAGSEILTSTASTNYKALLGKIESVWQKDLPSVPFEYKFVDEEVQKQYKSEITLSNIINSFTLVAIFISCLGLFGLAAFSAEQRRKEIGVRKVLGASVSGIAGLLSKEFVKLVFIAFLIATPISWWLMNKWLQNFAYRVSLTWWMFALAGMVAFLITLFTVSSQAIKAAVANPVKSLRTE